MALLPMTILAWLDGFYMSTDVVYMSTDVVYMSTDVVYMSTEVVYMSTDVYTRLSHCLAYSCSVS